MAGVLFVVTIPTEPEERSLQQKSPDSKNSESEKYENGAYKLNLPDDPLDADEFEVCDGLLNISQNSSMEFIMNELFKKLNIDNAVWQLSKNTKFHQITFFVESNARHELVLSTLNEWGIGQRNDSCLSMIPCTIFNQSSKPEELDPKKKSAAHHKQTAWEKFMRSVHARYNVSKIVQRVKEDATLTFDFVTLILVAGMLAAFGLIENDTTTLISSMLISPLMGPIIATIFGIVIKDHALIRFALINEVIGILMATLIGFCFGLIMCSIDSEYAYGSKETLTTEMINRCKFHKLLIGVLTALPTGAAAAIAILGDNFGSLVGVAISVSLLPPAVNAGVLWSLAVLYKLNEKDEALFSKVITSNYYSNHQSIELAVHGAISMLLTIFNVLSILVVGVVILRIKEVSPLTRNQRQLWKHDVKVARNYNKSTNANEDRTLAGELKEFKRREQSIRNMYNQSYQNTWSPMSMHVSEGDPVGIPMGYQSTNLYLEPIYPKRTYSKRRNSMPSSTSPPKSSSSKPVTRFRLEKIPEIVLPSSSSNSEVGSTNSNELTIEIPKKSHTFIVTPSDIDDTPLFAETK